MKKVLIALVLLVSPLFSNTSEATRNSVEVYKDCEIFCPKCRSGEVNHTHIDGSSTYYAVCRICGYQWYGSSSK